MKPASIFNNSLYLYFLLVFLVGTLIRTVPIYLHDFPVNDGGLFYTMTQDLIANHYRIPQYTSYNQDHIPFAYPPLAFYLTGIIHQITGIELIQLFRFLPLIFTSLTIPTFAFFTYQLTKSKHFSLIATFFFALTPSVYPWLIMGGGIPRALGLVWALFYLGLLVNLKSTTSNKSKIFAGIIGGLTILTHTEQGLFIFISSLVLIFIRTPLKELINTYILTVLTIGVLISPWLTSVVLTHGISPLLSAVASGGNNLFLLQYFFTLDVTSEPFLTIIAFAGLAGLIICWHAQQYLLIIWFLFMLLQRNGPLVSSIPLSITASIAILWLTTSTKKDTLYTAVKSLDFLNKNLTNTDLITNTYTKKIILICVTAYLVFSNLVLNFYKDSSPYNSITRQHQSTMAWINNNTPPDSQFLILTDAPSWQLDYLQEWFPALTNRQSISLVQGYEWKVNEFRLREKDYFLLENLSKFPDRLKKEINTRQFTHLLIYSNHPLYNLMQYQSNVLAEYKIIYTDNESLILKRLNL